MDTISNWYENLSRGGKIALFVTAAIIFSTCCLSILGYSFVNTTWNQGISFEKQLTAQYLDNQNYLSSFTSGFYENVSVVQAGSAALDQVLQDAVKGRYDKGGFTVGSPMFAAILEAYPEAGPAQMQANWGKVQDYVSAGREGYRAVQSKLLDQLRAYDTWRETGLVKRVVVRILGFPSNNLEARLGDSVVTGEFARNQMYRIVLASDVFKAYETGVMDPLMVPTP